jgi:hypothetical protein
VLFGGYFAYAAFLTGQPVNVPGIQTISADDGEDDSDSGDDDNEDNDNDEDKDKDDDSKSGENKKKDAEKKREDAKRAAERAREAAKRSSGDVRDDDMDDEGEGESEDEFEDKDEDEDDQTAMFKDHDKTLEKLNEKIAKAEADILKKQSEGVDVTAALAQLTLAKASLGSVEAAFTANELDKIQSLAKSTEKLASSARGKTLRDSEDVVKDIAKVAKRIAQTKEKIATLERLGGVTTTYVASLTEAETAFAAVKAQIAAGGESLLSGLAALETVERRVKSIKNSVEGALLALGVDDDEFEDEHDAEIGDVSDDLTELAEVDEDRSALRNLALAHKSEAKKVSMLVKNLNERNVVARELFGNDDDILDELRSEVTINENRIAAMRIAASKVEDSELKPLMQGKISELTSENSKLMSFITAQAAKSGVFGWLLKLF